jgi:hypothetical protein
LQDNPVAYAAWASAVGLPHRRAAWSPSAASRRAPSWSPTLISATDRM